MPAMQNPNASPIGRKTPRVDGPLKVSGTAMYASDFHFPGMLYAVPVEATIASGKIHKLDTAAAEKMPGVRAIFHRDNIGKIFRSSSRARDLKASSMNAARRLKTMSFATTANTSRSLSPILSRARKLRPMSFARPMRRRNHNVDAISKPTTSPTWLQPRSAPVKRLQSERGDPEKAFASAPVKLDQTYVTPTETHNPIELQATTAIWDGEKLTIYEESQGIFNLRGVLAQMFGLPKENVRVITKFVGSGFGSKLWPWTHCPLAVAAARQLGKPVKLVSAAE